MNPLSCPHCFRINAFLRKRTGRLHVVEHSSGEIVETWIEVMCRRCNRKYWLFRLHGRGTSAHIDFRPQDGASCPALIISKRIPGVFRRT
ncbi:MAG TPA: hypothetical protein VLS90_01055 [Thermodesulfobacteriota bacterium]|nr:hypothetical protein [Thermodesulfobacteriota bacterium]